MAREGREGIKRALAAVVAAAALLVSSCAGSPAARLAPESAIPLLGSGAAAYLVCDAASVLPILEAAVPKLKGDARFADMAARTRSASIAVFSSGDTHFRLVALGDYPTFQISFSLTFSGDWKKVSGSRPYWKSKTGLSLAFGPSGELIVSDGPPWVGDGGPAVPASFYSLRADSSLRLWLPEPASTFSRLISGGGEDSIRLPMTELAASLKRSDGTGGAAVYGAECVITAAGEREASALQAILRFARNLVKSDDADPRRRAVSKLLRSSLTSDGASLRFSAEGLTPEEIASFLPSADGALLYP